MTGVVARPRSGAMRGPQMPTILWLIAGAGVWLAAVGATCALLSMSTAGPRRGGPPDVAGLVEPRIGTIVIDLREPRLAGWTSAIAPVGRDPRRLRRPPASVELEHSRSRNTYALHVRGDRVARLRWRSAPCRPAGWYLSQQRGGWQRLAIDAELDADLGRAARRPASEQAADLAA